MDGAHVIGEERHREMLARESVASAPRHWVRLCTACNNRCVFCLDGDQARDLLLSGEAIRDDLSRGRERGAERVVLSGGEASVHPRFVDTIRLARELGYTWVQTISNGVRFADPSFLGECVDAGLDEVTFSVHGHTPSLHDRLTGHPGAFRAVVAAVAGAVRTPRLVVSVDILLCGENVAVLDRIVELCLGLGVREFDLLQVIPQGRAFENADAMLYEPAEHLQTLRRVLRLSRHPSVTIWTNRLPARYLEGFEELIQDPHKIEDEVHGRERELRAWLDDGVALPCRQRGRCERCFLEPFCAYVDGTVRRLVESRFEVLGIVGASPDRLPWGGRLPFGCSRLEVEGGRVEEWWGFRQEGTTALILAPAAPVDPRALGTPALPVTLRLGSPEELEAGIPGGDLPPGVTMEIEVGTATAAWALSHRAALERCERALRFRQSGPESLESGGRRPVDPKRLFEALGFRRPVTGLPGCLVGPATAEDRPATLPLDLFEVSSGRVSIGALVAGFVREGYEVKSLRCVGCAHQATCRGLQVNLARVLGLGSLAPLAGPVRSPGPDDGALPGGGPGWDPDRPAHRAPRLEVP